LVKISPTPSREDKESGRHALILNKRRTQVCRQAEAAEPALS
jgi:hypothetical protein